MILIPAVPRTRSSLVAGIFAACGAWVGPTTTSDAGYITYENGALVKHLRETNGGNVGQWIKNNVTVANAVLKFNYVYSRQIMKAFPQVMLVKPHRERDLSSRARGLLLGLKSQTRSRGIWINTDDLLDRNFDAIRPLIVQAGLVWNDEQVENVFIRREDNG